MDEELPTIEDVLKENPHEHEWQDTEQEDGGTRYQCLCGEYKYPQYGI